MILLHILLTYAKSNTRDNACPRFISAFHFVKECAMKISSQLRVEGNIKLFFLVLSYQSLSHFAVVVSSSSHPITRLSSHKGLYHLVYYRPQIPFRITGKIQTWSFSRRRAFNFSGKLHTKLKFSTEAWLSFFFLSSIISFLFSFD